MAVKEFEVGKFYRWIGPKDFKYNWNEYMEAWKDGNWRECISKNDTRSQFRGMDCDIHPHGWFYRHCMEHFEERKDSPFSFPDGASASLLCDGKSLDISSVYPLGEEETKAIAITVRGRTSFKSRASIRARILGI